MHTLSLIASLLSLVARKLRLYGINFSVVTFLRSSIPIPPQFHFILTIYIYFCLIVMYHYYKLPHFFCNCEK